MKTRIMALCEARHTMPDIVNGAVFPNSIDPLAIEDLEKTASDTLENVDSLILYVTGLSVALVAVINVCHDKGINLLLMHYNRDTGEYYPQKVK